MREIVEEELRCSWVYNWMFFVSVSGAMRLYSASVRAFNGTGRQDHSSGTEWTGQHPEGRRSA